MKGIILGLPRQRRKVGIILAKGLASRIAARQAPPQQQPPAAPQDRAAWQANYVAQSRSGTDVYRPGATVGDTGITDDAMNKMTPQERIAHLQKIATQAPPVPHYQVTPQGAVHWGHAAAGSRPLEVGDKLLSHRDPLKPPVPVKVAGHMPTALGRGMRLSHPEGGHETMHGMPLHPLTLDTPEHRAVAAKTHQARVLFKSEVRGGKEAKRKLKVQRRHHKPREGREGRDHRGHDFWYHMGWLREHEPAIAHNCDHDVSHETPPAPADGGGGDLAMSFPGDPRHIDRPGSRGGKFYYDERGRVVYGERPAPHFRVGQPGDHALVSAPPPGSDRADSLTGHHARVLGLGDGTARVRYSETGHEAEVPSGQVTHMAPGHLHGDELSPEMNLRHDVAHISAEENGVPRYNPEPPPIDAVGNRMRLKANPQPGDRFHLAPDAPPSEVQGADDNDVRFNDHNGNPNVMSRHDWRRSMQDEFAPAKTNYNHPRRFDAQEAAWTSPRDAVADALFAIMLNTGGVGGPTDTSADTPTVAAMRQQMMMKPWVGDMITATRDLSLNGTRYTAGAGLTAAYVQDDEAELYDHFGNPVATLDLDNWRDLLAQNAILPMKRGDAPEPEAEVPEKGVLGVFKGKVSRAEVHKAYTGDYVSGLYNTQIYHAEASHGMYNLYGAIEDDDGENVGNFERSLIRHGDGTVEVHHNILEVYGAMKEGFAEEFNRKTEAEYQRWGVDRVTLYANISVGKYAWARQGYDFDNEDTREAMVQRFVGFCQTRGHTVPDAKILQLQHSWNIAEYADGPQVAVQSYPEDKNRPDENFVVDGTYPLGKAFLLADPARSGWEDAGGSWNGIKKLSDKDHPTMRQTKRYRKERDQR